MRLHASEPSALMTLRWKKYISRFLNRITIVVVASRRQSSTTYFVLFFVNCMTIQMLVLMCVCMYKKNKKLLYWCCCCWQLTLSSSTPSSNHVVLFSLTKTIIVVNHIICNRCHLVLLRFWREYYFLLYINCRCDCSNAVDDHDDYDDVHKKENNLHVVNHYK